MIPFSFARVLQFSAISARLFAFVSTSGDTERLRRLRLAAEAGVARVETLELENERRLSGVYGVDDIVPGV